jgi:peptidoglycan/LPS O-acetylase OafA/YrhL
MRPPAAPGAGGHNGGAGPGAALGAYSLAFFALAGLIALALPTGRRRPRSALAGELIGWLVWLVMLIVFIVSLPILWLLALLYPLALAPRMPPPPQRGPPARRRPARCGCSSR